MAGPDWVAGLTVAKLKDELKKRGQPTTGKKAELVARLEAYINEHEVTAVLRELAGSRVRHTRATRATCGRRAACLQGTPEEMKAARQAAGADNAAEASQGAGQADARPEAPSGQPGAPPSGAAAADEPGAEGAEKERPGAEEVEQAMAVDVAPAAAASAQADAREGAATAAPASGPVPAADQQAEKDKRQRTDMKQQAGKTPGKGLAGVAKRVGRPGGAGRPGAPKRPGPAGFGALTMADISADKLTKLAKENWSHGAEAKGERLPYAASLVAQLYRDELGGSGDKPPANRRRGA